MNLFDLVDKTPQQTAYASDWRPDEPPDLSEFDEIGIDFETDGLKWWAGNKPIGAAVWTPKRSYWLPWGFRGGGNLDEAVVKRFFHEQVKHKKIRNLNVGFEVQMALAWGVDLEAQGNTMSDAGHWAALLDDWRKRFSQEELVKDFLGRDTTWDPSIDKSHMVDYHASRIAAGALGDVNDVHAMWEVMRPRLEEEDLMRVLDLEERAVWPTCEMVRNASPIDTEKLVRWEREVASEMHRLLIEVHAETGVKVNPDSSKDWQRLYDKLGIEIVDFTDGTVPAPSFTDEVLRRANNPSVEKARRAGKLADLLSKFFTKFRKTIGPDCLLRYSLHQMRSDEGGTVSGRYSSSAIKVDRERIGTNIQAVSHPEKQEALYGPGWMVRELFVPACPGCGKPKPACACGKSAGTKYLSADADAAEYRIFADLVKSERLIQAYRENPRMKFHRKVQEFIGPHAPDLIYKDVKNLDFMKIYGGGMTKMAFMLRHITAAQFRQLTKEKAKWSHPLLRRTLEVNAIYNRELPEVEPFLKKMMAEAEINGFVRTELGRRMRFPTKQRLHKAANGVIQGTAADDNKEKLIELHAERKATGFIMRLTNHDEVCGDSPDRRCAEMVGEILDRQTYARNRAIPALWNTAEGENWKECKD